jgi:hypothetical protein
MTDEANTPKPWRALVIDLPEDGRSLANIEARICILPCERPWAVSLGYLAPDQCSETPNDYCES